MKKLTTEEIEQVALLAESYYDADKFYCSEAVLMAVLDSLGYTYDKRIIGMASGFPVGIGGAECLCGAVSGGVMAVGYVHGRSEMGDPKVADTMARSREVRDRFVARNRTTCCHALIRRVKGKPEHILQCKRFVREVTKDVLEIVLRE